MELIHVDGYTPCQTDTVGVKRIAKEVFSMAKRVMGMCLLEIIIPNFLRKIKTFILGIQSQSLVTL